MNKLHEFARAAKQAKAVMTTATTEQKNSVLTHLISHITANTNTILAANAKDIALGHERNLADSLLDRLMLNEERIAGIITSLNQIIALRDPVGEITELEYMPSGIQVGKMRVPLGVVGIIYESRPNVTIDAAALCLKSGNVTILRGGKEALHSNIALHTCIAQSLIDTGLDSNAVQLITDTNRALVSELVSNEDYIDVVIPRGGKGLVQAIKDSAKVPVIKHLDGVCHTYIDELADKKKAIDIAYNAKTRRYGVCNAMETLLIHADFATDAVSELIEKYIQKGVELRGCERMVALDERIIPATEADWSTEYLDAILSIKMVDSMEEAIVHINTYGSGHTESIVCESVTKGRIFLSAVDSSSVMINASTGFADGFEYGLGAEIGISTDKFHARGPVGLAGLTSQKFIVLGDGHIRP